MSVVPNSAPTASSMASSGTIQANTSSSSLNAGATQTQAANNSSQNNANAMLSEERVRQHQQYMQQQQFANLSVSALSSAMMTQFNPAATGSSPVASTVSLNSFLQSSPISQNSISTLSSTLNSTSPSVKKFDLPSQTSQNAGNHSTPSYALNTSSTRSTVPANTSVDQQNQSQQAIVYDDINIFMWSVCQICNKVSQDSFSHFWIDSKIITCFSFSNR